ncbi:hypothetical protein C8R44DRAFT_246117 [Mycena epipterygia]|nr:hypothetical protein C8R44DRAFT_246117 [Mycena epipterygia]
MPTQSVPQSPLSNSNEHIKCLIDTSETNILRITSQIRELESALQKERSTLARLWLMITPMGRLPTELLAEIFTHAVQLDALCTDNALSVVPRSPTRQVLVLSQVSPYWRQIVNSTPRLWTAGVIDVRVKSSLTEEYLNGLKTLLELSAPLPIAVSFTQDGDEGGTGVSTTAISRAATTTTVIRAMVPTAHRWKSLKVDCLSFRPLAQLPGGTFSELESLDMQYERYGQTDPVCAFFPAPRLRHLSLLFFGTPHTSLLMPWAQLNHLQLTHPSLAGCREILLQCANLCSADLTTTEWDFAHTTTGGIVTAPPAPATVLPSLEALKVQFDAGNDDIGHVEPFFEPLTLPALRTLDLKFDAAPEVLWPSAELSAFQARCPHITHISLTYCPISPTELASLLRLAPALASITLKSSCHCITDDFLQQLRYDGDDGDAPLAPQLREVHWQDVGHAFSEPVLEAVVRSRWWAEERVTRVARLQKVSVSFNASAGLLEDVVRQGLELNLSIYEY